MTSTLVHGIVNGKWRENCYIVSGPDGSALVIDPGVESDRIAEYLDDHRLSPSAILVTHAHHDHVGALPALIERYSVPWYIHSNEQHTLKHMNLLRKFFDAAQPLKLPEPDGYVDELGSPLTIEGFHPEFVETPGHTRGGVSFIIGDALFPGDTLFRRGVGRVDLPGGDPHVLGQSLFRLSRLAPTMVVYPGHGNSTTLADVLSNNLDLRKMLDERQAN
jgi:hydroxyacylglutathione hydrolase